MLHYFKTHYIYHGGVKCHTESDDRPTDANEKNATTDIISQVFTKTRNELKCDKPPAIPGLSTCGTQAEKKTAGDRGQY